MNDFKGFIDQAAGALGVSTGEAGTAGGDPAGREAVAAKTGLSESVILKWANMADLMRISGVGSQFSELLNGSGVDTIKELRNRNAANLAAKMLEVNTEKKLAKTSPTEATVTKWVEAAKTMDPKLTY